MRKVKLAVWLRKRTQRELSFATGITQGSISAMLHGPRDIYVVQMPDGNIRLLEHKWLNQ